MIILACNVLTTNIKYLTILIWLSTTSCNFKRTLDTPKTDVLGKRFVNKENKCLLTRQVFQKGLALRFANSDRYVLETCFVFTTIPKAHLNLRYALFEYSCPFPGSANPIGYTHYLKVDMANSHGTDTIK